MEAGGTGLARQTQMLRTSSKLDVPTAKVIYSAIFRGIREKIASWYSNQRQKRKIQRKMPTIWEELRSNLPTTSPVPSAPQYLYL